MEVFKPGQASSVSAPHPTSTPNKQQRAWTTGSGFDTLGWAPDGEVRGSYVVKTPGPTDFDAAGTCDVDGDGNDTWFMASKTQNVTMTTGNNVY